MWHTLYTSCTFTWPQTLGLLTIAMQGLGVTLRWSFKNELASFSPSLSLSIPFCFPLPSLFLPPSPTPPASWSPLHRREL